MHTHFALRPAGIGGLTMFGLACNVIDKGSNCQLYAPDDNWTRVGLHAVMQVPSEAQCPLSLTNFGVRQDYLARIDAPYGTPALASPQVDTRIWDVNGQQSGVSSGYFGVGSDGREYANDQGFYYAGRGGGTTTKLQQDQADTYIPLDPRVGGGVAANSVFLPYKCCQFQTLVSTLPRTPRGSKVTIRTWTNYLWPKYRWWLNGKEILVPPPGGGLGNPVPPGSSFTATMNTAGTFNWGISIVGSRAGENKGLSFKMVVY